MKYLKKFEMNETIFPQIGDYVLIVQNIRNISPFVNENIGTFIGMNDSSIFLYKVQYENIPEELLQFADNKNKNILNFSYDEITYWSKDKKELELMITTNKFNL